MMLSDCRNALGVLLIVVAGCTGYSTPLPAPPLQTSALTAVVPACKGQTSTKEYASGPAQPLQTKGGLLCVPRFKDWGGSISYPGPTTAGNTMSLISSTTAYSGPLWPPNPPGAPIFYLQFTVNSSSITFGSKVPSGGALASKVLKIKKPYTVYASLQAFGSVWAALGECYTTAFSGKYGPSLTRIGTAFAAQNFKGQGTRGVIEIVPGKYVSNKC